MEVHHHAHHGQEKKTWKKYFWEFFMLFLAVFCGFLAEYQLEHKIERDREKVYMKNLIEDLQGDLSNFNNYQHFVRNHKLALDSLFLLIKSPKRNLYLSNIYLLARKLTITPVQLLPNQRTYEQMKNSGHLRLIHHRNTATAVSKYYLDIQGIIDQNIYIRDRVNLYQTEIGNLFDAEILWQIFNTRKMPANDHLKFLSEDPVVINRYLTAAQYIVSSQFRQNDRLVESSKKCKELIDLIKEAYY